MPFDPGLCTANHFDGVRLIFRLALRRRGGALRSVPTLGHQEREERHVRLPGVVRRDNEVPARLERGQEPWGKVYYYPIYFIVV